MSIRKFKLLGIICLPALLFALTYAISLNASPGRYHKCYKGILEYGEQAPTCSSKDGYETECNGSSFSLVAKSGTYCYYTATGADYCTTIYIKDLTTGTGNCTYEDDKCTRDEASAELNTGVSITYCQ